MVYAYAHERGIHVSLANNGDDCVVIMETADLDKFTGGLDEWFLEMGFSMKVECPVYEIEHIEFCQTHPVWTPNGYVMVRNFPKALSKDCLSLKLMDSPQVARDWLAAVGEGGLALTGGIPVYQDFYSALYRASQSVVVPVKWKHQQNSAYRRRERTVELTGGIAWLSKGMERRYVPIDPKTRVSFWMAFGLTPDRQECLENYYQGAKFNHKIVGGASQHLPNWG